MSLSSLALLGFAMSADAFAAAIGKGATMTNPCLVVAIKSGLIFGLIEAITPVFGWYLGSTAFRFIMPWSHWAAFILLLGLGLHIIYNGIKHDHKSGQQVQRRHHLLTLTLTGLSTSIDAFAIGVTFAFIDVPISLIAVIIGSCTFCMVTLGIMLGRIMGTVIGKGAEIVGGLILIGVGSVILYGHFTSEVAQRGAQVMQLQ
jgi:manganese efflux pump family protein